MKEVQVIIEHTGENLSAYVEGAPIITTGYCAKKGLE